MKGVGRGFPCEVTKSNDNLQPEYSTLSRWKLIERRLVVWKDVEREVGHHQVTLAPATVLLQENNSTTGWFRGNLGMDLLNQARGVDVDFESMTLTLQ